MPDGTVDLTADVAHAGDEGFEWGTRADGSQFWDANYNGVKLVRLPGLGIVFAHGIAGYHGEFDQDIPICRIPDGWEDFVGNVKGAQALGDQDDPRIPVMLNISGSPRSLQVALAGPLPANGYVEFTTFWFTS